MKVLFDTNVIIDAVTSRYNDFKDSRDLVLKVVNGEIEGYVSAKQLTDIYYIMRKYTDSETYKRYIINMICETFNILPILPSDILASLHTKIDDFEDAVIEETAKVNMVQYIVTHNNKHFAKSKLIIATPKELNTLLSVES